MTKVVVIALGVLALLYGLTVATRNGDEDSLAGRPDWVDSLKARFTPDRPMPARDLSGTCVEPGRRIIVGQFCQVDIGPSKSPVRTLQLSVVSGQLEGSLVQKGQMTVNKELSQGGAQQFKVFKEGGRLILSGCFSGCELTF